MRLLLSQWGLVLPLVFTTFCLPPLKRVRVAVLADVGQAASVETACGAEGAEPMMEVSNSQEQDAEPLDGALAALADEISAGQAEGV